MNFEQNQQQCLEKLFWATEQLQVKVDPGQLSKIAKLIVQTMTGCWRYFHTPEHIFEVGGYRDAIEVLAALFHDVVYVQVDGSINFNLTYYLAPFIEENVRGLCVREQSELPNDPTFRMVMAIFGFVPGQGLSPLAGQNEFLSAVVAAKALDFVSSSILVQIITCIEATIPFRSNSASGSSPCELLYQRLRLTNEQFNLQLTEPEIVQAVKRSVRLSNRDVCSFADSNSAVFLASTWNLLPESNHSLQKSGSYTVRDYRKAIQKMTDFMNFLKPELVFRQFQEEPDTQTHRDLVERARRNLEVGRFYLESKLVTITIVEALSLRLGSDISLSIMMGELPGSEFSLGRLGDSLPNIPQSYAPVTDVEKEVWDLLTAGRSGDPKYDLRNSPLASFVVKFVGFDEIRRLRTLAKEFFQNNISSEDFLGSCNAALVGIIINEVARLIENRKVSLCHPRREIILSLV